MLGCCLNRLFTLYVTGNILLYVNGCEMVRLCRTCIGHDFYWSWWLLKELFVSGKVLTSVAWGSFLTLNHSWKHFLKVSLFGCHCVPEPVDACDEFLFVGWLHGHLQVMLSLCHRFSMGFMFRLSAGVGRYWIPLSSINCIASLPRSKQ